MLKYVTYRLSVLHDASQCMLLEVPAAYVDPSFLGRIALTVVESIVYMEHHPGVGHDNLQRNVVSIRYNAVQKAAI